MLEQGLSALGVWETTDHTQNKQTDAAQQGNQVYSEGKLANSGITPEGGRLGSM